MSYPYGPGRYQKLGASTVSSSGPVDKQPSRGQASFPRQIIMESVGTFIFMLALSWPVVDAFATGVETASEPVLRVSGYNFRLYRGMVAFFGTYLAVMVTQYGCLTLFNPSLTLAIFAARDYLGFKQPHVSERNHMRLGYVWMVLSYWTAQAAAAMAHAILLRFMYAEVFVGAAAASRPEGYSNESAAAFEMWITAAVVFLSGVINIRATTGDRTTMLSQHDKAFYLAAVITFSVMVSRQVVGVTANPLRFISLLALGGRSLSWTGAAIWIASPLLGGVIGLAALWIYAQLEFSVQ